MDISLYTTDNKSSIILVMKKINTNKKGFLLVLDGKKLVGTITDGDIRRALIHGISPDSDIQAIYVSSFQYLTMDDGIEEVIERFKQANVKFLPIVDDDMYLRNIITKPNMHALLLQNISYDPAYDFCGMDDSLLEHEIYARPWGFYKTAFLNQYCQCKTIYVNPKSSLSLQKHLQREEHWIIVHGEGIARIGDEVMQISAGSSVHIAVGVLHRLSNTSEKDSLIVTEVQLGNYFGEDDIIRVEDEYGRC